MIIRKQKVSTSRSAKREAKVATSASIFKEPRFSTKEAAGILQKCTKTVLKLIAAKRIAPVIRYAKAGPGSIEIPESSLARYKASLVQGVIS